MIPIAPEVFWDRWPMPSSAACFVATLLTLLFCRPLTSPGSGSRSCTKSPRWGSERRYRLSPSKGRGSGFYSPSVSLVTGQRIVVGELCRANSLCVWEKRDHDQYRSWIMSERKVMTFRTHDDASRDGPHHGSRRMSDTHPDPDLSCSCGGGGVGLYGCRQRERAQPPGSSAVGTELPRSRAVDQSLSCRLG